MSTEKSGKNNIMLGHINEKILGIAKKIVNYEEKKLEIDRLKKENRKLKKSVELFGWPAGHFYSPIHKLEDLNCYDEVKKRSCDKFVKSIPGFSDKKMLVRFSKLKKFFSDFDYLENDDGKCHFYIKNCSYPITDALILFSMIRDLKPKRIIEIGSGFTSALMMDINERFFKNKIDITFIEPYPELLIKKMDEDDKSRYKIIKNGVQFVSIDIFKTLKKGDILFIDSTHVSKFNSDVNYELFNILPELNSGVIIHFHDTFDGFEYPIKWLSDGWAWNEDYLLRAYLIGNVGYEVLLMNDYLANRYPEILLESFPKYKNLNGGSLWLLKK
jgi:hypothetical protein